VERPPWPQYFMAITKLVASRSTCIRRKVGAILVKDKRILCTGYNGAPSGLKHCEEIGCIRANSSVASGERHELCRGLHAEQNVIVQAAYYGIPIAKSDLYCTNKPCSICAKLIINAGIKRIFFEEDYNDALSDLLLNEAGVEVIKLNP